MNITWYVTEMIKECRTWAAVVQVKSDTGRKRLDVLVVASDFDSAVGMLQRAYPGAEVTNLMAGMYDAVVTGD